MASSGSFNTSAYSNRHLVFRWSTKVVTIESNYTVINWTLKGAGSASGYYMAAPFKVVIDGETVYSSSTRIELRNGTVVASGEKVISHNADGSRKFTASVSAAIYSKSENVSGSGSWDLERIPRAATITAAPNFNDEENPTINYSNLAGNNVTTLQACISFTGAAADIAYRDISKTGTSYTFNLTEAERNVLRNGTTTANSRKVFFFIKTVINGNTYMNSVEKTLTIVNAMPTLNPTITDTNSTTTAKTGNNSIFVKGLSNAAITTGVAAKKGATITSVKITCGSKSLTANGTINAVESGTFTITATDSRGNMVTQSIKKTFVEYIKPTIYLQGTNITASGNTTITITGSLYNGTIGAYNNAANYSISFNYVINGKSETMVTKITDVTLNGNNFTANVNLTGLNYQYEYNFRASIEDAFYRVNAELPLMSKPVFEWGKDEFNFNVPVNIDGDLTVEGESIITDYIVDQGIEDGWIYRKWKSGIGECWKTIAHTTTINNAWGGGLYAGTMTSRQNYPFAFKDKPVENVSLTAGASAAFIYAESGGNGVNGTYASACYNIARPAAVTSSITFYISYYVIGKYQ
jgi:hypothetical protein